MLLRPLPIKKEVGMSDQNDIEMDSGDAGVADGSSKGAGLLPQLLKWIAISLGALIFIVTVVVITVNVMGLTGRSTTTAPVSEEYIGQQDVLDWYQAVNTIQTRSADTIAASIMVDVALGFTFGDKSTPAELSSRIVELRDFLRSFFNSKTVSELKNEAKIKIEIRNYINDNILTRTKIRDVRFTRYDIIEQ